MLVAAAAASTAGNDRALASSRQLGDDITGRRVANDGAGRDAQLDAGAVSAVLLVLGAVATAFGAKLALEAQFAQAVHRLIGDEHDVTAAAAIAAVRAAARARTSRGES